MYSMSRFPGIRGASNFKNSLPRSILYRKFTGYEKNMVDIVAKLKVVENCCKIQLFFKDMKINYLKRRNFGESAHFRQFRYNLAEFILANSEKIQI